MLHRLSDFLLPLRSRTVQRMLGADPEPHLGPQVVEPIEYRSPQSCLLGKQVAEHQRRRHSVFVPNRATHGVAEGLFVSEREPAFAAFFQCQAGVDDPFEPGQGGLVPGAAEPSDHAQHRTGDDGVDHDRALRVFPVAEDIVPEQDPDLVPAEQAPPTWDRHRRSQAVGVGIVGDHEASVKLAGEAQR